MKFFWRREDEFGQGWYRPAQVARLKAALDPEGRVTGLHVRTAGPALASSFSLQGLPAGQLDGSSVQTIRESRYKPLGVPGRVGARGPAGTDGALALGGRDAERLLPRVLHR